MKQLWTTFILTAAGLLASHTGIPPQAAAQDGDLGAVYDQLVNRGIAYYGSVQNDQGTFDTNAGPGGIALIATALMRNGVPAEHPLVEPSLTYLVSLVDDTTGGIYAKDSRHQNYETCLAIMAFAEANQNGKYDAIMENAEQYLKNIQWGGPQYSADEEDFAYGGAGYGSHERPDLSNTSFLVDALQAAGTEADDAAIQRALKFVSRTQNFESPANSAPFAAKNPDGGFYYTPAAGGESQAGETANGGLRSYGSMTYAGLKSMIYAGVSKDDPRVQAAMKWLKKNYSVEENPNMGATGLFYYYQTFAKALAALGDDTFVDAEGVEHDWRAELIRELATRQQTNGSWVNTEAARWLENDEPLVTAYTLLALSYAKPTAK